MIDEISQALGGATPAAVYALLAFAAVTFVLQIAALIDLVRRERVMWDRKWVWALIILLVSNGIGAVLWFALGRRVPQETLDAPEEGAATTERARRAVDVLYGDGKDPS